MITSGQQVHARTAPGRLKPVTLPTGNPAESFPRVARLALTFRCEIHGVSLHGVWHIPFTCVAVSVVVHVAMVTPWEGARLGQQRGCVEEQLAHWGHP